MLLGAICLGCPANMEGGGFGISDKSEQGEGVVSENPVVRHFGRINGKVPFISTLWHYLLCKFRFLYFEREVVLQSFWNCLSFRMIDSVLTFTHCLQFVNHNNYGTWQRTFIFNLIIRSGGYRLLKYLNVAMIYLFDTRS